jgi:hypothetical protein
VLRLTTASPELAPHSGIAGITAKKPASLLVFLLLIRIAP